MIEKTNIKKFPGSIRELLLKLVDRKVTIILDANAEPETIKIEAVCGNLLIAKIVQSYKDNAGHCMPCDKDKKFKFVNIDCICEVIVDCDELIESILHGKCSCEESHC